MVSWGRGLWGSNFCSPVAAVKRFVRVLWNDPETGVMWHADAGYEIAKQCAREMGLDLPMV